MEETILAQPKMKLPSKSNHSQVYENRRLVIQGKLLLRTYFT